MFPPKKASAESIKLSETIEEALAELNPHDDDYLDKVKAVETLYKLKDIDRPQRVSPDTVAIVSGNLAGILLILSYERGHVMATKALGFLKPLR